MQSETKDETSPWSELKGQIFLGDDFFVESLLREIPGKRGKLQEVPREQINAGRPRLEELFEGNTRLDKKRRNRAIHSAHVERGYTLQEIAEYLGMHYASISRIVGQVEREMLRYKT